MFEASPIRDPVMGRTVKLELKVSRIQVNNYIVQKSLISVIIYHRNNPRNEW